MVGVGHVLRCLTVLLPRISVGTMNNDGSAFQKYWSLTESAIGKVVERLMANEQFVQAVQRLVVASFAAKERVDHGLSQARQLARLATVDELNELRSRVEAIEHLIEKNAKASPRSSKAKDV